MHAGSKLESFGLFVRKNSTCEHQLVIDVIRRLRASCLARDTSTTIILVRECLKFYSAGTAAVDIPGNTILSTAEIKLPANPPTAKRV